MIYCAVDWHAIKKYWKIQVSHPLICNNFLCFVFCSQKESLKSVKFKSKWLINRNYFWTWAQQFPLQFSLSPSYCFVCLVVVVPFKLLHHRAVNERNKKCKKIFILKFAHWDEFLDAKEMHSGCHFEDI